MQFYMSKNERESLKAQERQSGRGEALREVFAELRKLGYFARTNFMCCAGCGWAAIDGDKEKVVFYNKQDNECKEIGRSFYLSWIGDAAEIIGALSRAGFPVMWDGNSGRRIRVLYSNWLPVEG